MSAANFKEILVRLGKGESLTGEEAAGAFAHMMSGSAHDSEIGAFLMALHLRGENVEEIAAGAHAMRAVMQPVQAPEGAIDLCGTGGDMSGTHNISTAAAFVVASCGVPVAKHGNKALSSRSGSADILMALGAKIPHEAETIPLLFKEAGIAFLFAPAHHPAARHVAPARQALGIRTIFNLLGPLCNPASVAFQLMGVFSAKWLEPLAHVLKDLGTKRAWVVHGEDGLDEITLTGKTKIAELHEGKIRHFTITPEDAGLAASSPQSLKGGTPQENAQAFRALMEGAKGAYRDIVLLNSAAALLVAGKAEKLEGGVKMASHALDSGKTKKVLDQFLSLSSGA